MFELTEPEVTGEVEFNGRSLRRAASHHCGSWIQDLVGDVPVWMVTITHAKLTTHPEFSAKVRRQWLHKLNKQIYGRHYDRAGEGLLSVFAFEWQKRGTVHQHGIVAGAPLSDLRRDLQSSLLAHQAQGFCKIELPRNRERSIRYCTKYISKGGELDWWLPRALKFNLETASVSPGYQREAVTG